MSIKIENIKVTGWEAAVRGMRNPKNSWDSSDSHVELILSEEPTFIPGDSGNTLRYPGSYEEVFRVGPNDKKLMRQLVAAGSDHRKFMRMLIFTCDVSAPLYWWKEADTYKVASVRNSCSTMHKIEAKKFVLDDFAHEHLLPGGLDALAYTIAQLNFYRDKFINGGDKQDWWQLIQLLPDSYIQRATVQFSYETLRNQYHARKNHKQDEWHTWAEMLETLPESDLIIETFKPELVDHPNHYNKPGRKECIVEMEEKFGTKAVYYFSLLSAFKYRYRKGDKAGEPGDRDVAKADWYDSYADKLFLKMGTKDFIPEPK